MTERKKGKRLEVFVGGLSKDVTEEDVREVFGKVGEVTEVRFTRDPETGRHKGFAFVKYAEVEGARRAAKELEFVTMKGKKAGVLPSEENDTLFVGNLNRSWGTEDLVETFASYGIPKPEEITLMEDPQHEGMNRGFAFVEFSSYKEAVTAWRLLQMPEAVFGTDRSAKVAWAQPLNAPDEETMAQVKSLFVDGLPPPWDEARVKEQFEPFGEVQRVVLAKKMMSAKRKDFGFVNFAERDAALAAMEALNNTEVLEGDVKFRMKITLAKPQSKSRPIKGGVRGGFPVRASRTPVKKTPVKTENDPDMEALVQTLREQANVADDGPKKAAGETTGGEEVAVTGGAAKEDGKMNGEESKEGETVDGMVDDKVEVKIEGKGGVAGEEVDVQKSEGGEGKVEVEAEKGVIADESTTSSAPDSASAASTAAAATAPGDVVEGKPSTDATANDSSPIAAAEVNVEVIAAPADVTMTASDADKTEAAALAPTVVDAATDPVTESEVKPAAAGEAADVPVAEAGAVSTDEPMGEAQVDALACAMCGFEASAEAEYTEHATSKVHMLLDGLRKKDSNLASKRPLSLLLEFVSKNKAELNYKVTSETLTGPFTITATLRGGVTALKETSAVGTASLSAVEAKQSAASKLLLLLLEDVSETELSSAGHVAKLRLGNSPAAFARPDFRGGLMSPDVGGRRGGLGRGRGRGGRSPFSPGRGRSYDPRDDRDPPPSRYSSRGDYSSPPSRPYLGIGGDRGDRGGFRGGRGGSPYGGRGDRGGYGDRAFGSPPYRPEGPPRGGPGRRESWGGESYAERLVRLQAGSPVVGLAGGPFGGGYQAGMKRPHEGAFYGGDDRGPQYRGGYDDRAPGGSPGYGGGGRGPSRGRGGYQGGVGSPSSGYRNTKPFDGYGGGRGGRGGERGRRGGRGGRGAY
eukprot:TRINITY_DN3480_c0_g1_i1.p1 TRINITY_DN3480_c0_g1~~TRINITY_DN3480_c0_g1_i1.p1  ORF type:complete len:919 (-),score=229.00 TRINITY_DN3480_c0_g1_i1:1344-4100(-)